MNKHVQLTDRPGHQVYLDAHQAAVAKFAHTRVAQMLNDGVFRMADYHTLLKTLFYQTYHGPYSFALAAANCCWSYLECKEYLLLHAEEEKLHWRWILNDLAATGYQGSKPELEPPHPTAYSYVALNFHCAASFPLARLAIASVLESIGPAYMPTLGMRLVETLSLSPNEVTFFVSHGETDKHHSADLAALISGLELSLEQWRLMAVAATTAGTLYSAMYDHEGFL